MDNPSKGVKILVIQRRDDFNFHNVNILDLKS